MMHFVLVAALLAVCGAQTIRPPIPVQAPESGIRYPVGAENVGRIRIDAFIELLCGDSAAALPILEQVVAHYSSEVVQLVVHQLPLPYHRNGFIAAQGSMVIRDQVPSAQFDFMHEILEHRAQFSNAVTQNMGDAEIIELLAFHATQATGIDPQLFIDQIGNYYGETVRVWKFGTNRNVAGTPWYFVNGVALQVCPGCPPVTFDDWIAFLDPLV